MALPIPVIDGILNIGGQLIKHWFPDPKDAANAELELIKLNESGDLQRMATEAGLLHGQIEVNKEEAKSGSLFIAGWRPAIGWTCAISLFMYYVPYCIVATVIWAMHCIETNQLVARPDLGIADLIGLMSAMLGIASMRSFDKVKNIATQRLESK